MRKAPLNVYISDHLVLLAIKCIMVLCDWYLKKRSFGVWVLALEEVIRIFNYTVQIN